VVQARTTARRRAVTDSWQDALAGLRRTPKELPCKYLYDQRGSQLFEQICRLEEYYLTRVELDILHRHSEEIARLAGPNARLIEPGAGTLEKAAVLLDRLEQPAGYIPIDVSSAALSATAINASRRFPGLEVYPILGDFAVPLSLPGGREPRGREVVFFPGSTIGNFAPDEASELLARLARWIAPGGAIVIGVDLKKAPSILERAYDDAKGVTAAFNRNVLYRMNRELDADFHPEAFVHRAPYSLSHGRIEMHLVSESPQRVRIQGETFEFRPGESIRTECSYKYSPYEFDGLVRNAGLQVVRTWMDDARWFGVFFLEPDVAG
jgi:L-histidine Nalpha-methyltransferase